MIRSQEVLGNSLLDRRQFAKAAALLEPVLDATVDHERGPHIRLLLARAKFGAGRSREGLALLEGVSAKTTGPLRAAALLARAEALHNAGRFQEAIDPLKAYLKENTDAPAADRARALLVICYGRTRKLFEAGEVYQQLRQRKVDRRILLPTTLQFAEAAFAAGNYDLSLSLFERLYSSSMCPT